MKKQITLAALGLLSLVGGSWLAAQQRELDLPARSSAPGALAEEFPSADAVSPARPAEDPAKPRRASSPSPQRSLSTTRPVQAARANTERYREDVAGFYVEEPTVRELNVADQRLWLPESRQRRLPEDMARMREFQDAIKELREADNDEDKLAARDRVTNLVSEQLETDLVNREKELAAIEQRAKELRKQLEERKTAKPELLKMLVMLIDNPQVGLGIPPEWMQMLMRGQPDRDRPAFPSTMPADTLFSAPRTPPSTPPQPPAPSRN